MFTQLIGGRLARAPIDSIPLHNVLDLATGRPNLNKSTKVDPINY